MAKTMHTAAHFPGCTGERGATHIEERCECGVRISTSCETHPEWQALEAVARAAQTLSNGCTDLDPWGKRVGLMYLNDLQLALQSLKETRRA